MKSGTNFTYSYLQENGAPQDSILSPMLFNLKINNKMKSVSDNVNVSLFVDDLAVFIECKHLKHLECTMQLCIKKIQKGIAENGFKFSISKTTCVHFHKQRIYTEPSLHLDGQAIPVKDDVKFVGLIFDNKLNFKSQVQFLKKKCQKALNILRVLGHTDWGAEKSIFLKLYRTLVGSRQCRIWFLKNIYFKRTGPNTSLGSARWLGCLSNLSNSNLLCGGGGAITRTWTLEIIDQLFSDN